MNFSVNVENGILTVALEGRLDTDSAVKFDAEIAEISKNNQHDSMVIDAEKLEYVASSGLRTILKLAKTEKNFSIEKVSANVYSVFEMTGFAGLLTII